MLRLFYWITLVLLVRVTSFVLISNETKCSTDTDCSHQLICHAESHTCICPQPYFWREDMQACFGCAPGWLDLENNKCIFYPISPPPGVTKYKVATICKNLLARPIFINSTNEFRALQDKIESNLNGTDAVASTVYFHQGAWIEINHEWIDWYTWCDNDTQGNSLDCVQIRQDNLTNTICLQYVSCSSPAQFICEAKPRTQLELEKNIAESGRRKLNNSSQETIPRARRQAPKRLVNQPISAPKKSSIWTGDNVASMFNAGASVIGSVAGTLSSIFGKKPPSPPQTPPPTPPVSHPAGPQSIVLNYPPEDLQAVAGNGGSSNLLLYCAIGGGILLIIVIVIVLVCCKKPKKKSKSSSSIASGESGASAVSNE